MVNVKCILGTVVLFTFYTWTESVALRNSTHEPPELTTSDRLELADQGLDGDTATEVGESGAFRRVQRNADPCVNTGCKWPRSSDGNVYVPFTVDSSFSWDALITIIFSMLKFSESTCVQFKHRTNEPDYVHIQPATGCWSSIGRRGGAQTLGLQYPDCFDNIGSIQHELLHALGFHHEHSRSDRDRHVRVNWENMDSGKKHNFKKVDTVNLGTRYDYNSVMHYGRFAGSNNDEPTLDAVPQPVEFGTATEMSPTDIERINRLYCTDLEADQSSFLSFLRDLFGL